MHEKSKRKHPKEGLCCLLGNWQVQYKWRHHSWHRISKYVKDLHCQDEVLLGFMFVWLLPSLDFISNFLTLSSTSFLSQTYITNKTRSPARKVQGHNLHKSKVFCNSIRWARLKRMTKRNTYEQLLCSKQDHSGVSYPQKLSFKQHSVTLSHRISTQSCLAQVTQ